MGMRLKENGARSYRFPSLATGVALGGHLRQTTMRFRQRRKVGKGALASRLPGPIHIHHHEIADPRDPTIHLEWGKQWFAQRDPTETAYAAPPPFSHPERRESGTGRNARGGVGDQTVPETLAQKEQDDHKRPQSWVLH